jgi:thiol oxidase
MSNPHNRRPPDEDALLEADDADSVVHVARAAAVKKAEAAASALASAEAAAGAAQAIEEEMQQGELDTADTGLDEVYTRVHSTDLGSTIIHILRTEVSTHQPIAGHKLETLRKLLLLLIEFVKVSPILDKALVRLEEISRKTDSIATHTEWVVLLEQARIPQVQQHPWKQCQGSKPWLRGYPCGLWSLFHTIMAGATASTKPEHVEALHPPEKHMADPLVMTGDEVGRDAMKSIALYIGTFFGCEECVENFKIEYSVFTRGGREKIQVGLNGGGKPKMVRPETINGMASLDLWNLHNSVNIRLGSNLEDESNDPEHLKIEFPSRDQCPDCRNPPRDQKRLGEWRTTEVLSFLQRFYYTTGRYNKDLADGYVSPPPLYHTPMCTAFLPCCYCASLISGISCACPQFGGIQCVYFR